MYLNQFSVKVIGGKEVSGGYVEMVHGRQYTLSLRNDRSQRCDARVEIDGKHVGTWRIDPHRTITLERPEHDQARFTFYRLGTSESEAAQLQAGDPNLGLVKVTFTPEWAQAVKPLRPYPSPPWYPWPPNTPVWYRQDNSGSAQGTGGTWIRSLGNDAPTMVAAGDGHVTLDCAMPAAAAASYDAGGTGLSGHSAQQYGTADWIGHDLSQQTVIHLRLVVGEATETPRPLTTYSTPVPPAVG